MWDMAVITPIAFVVVGAGLALWGKAELDRLAAAAGGRETTDGCGQTCPRPTRGGAAERDCHPPSGRESRPERALEKGRSRRAQ